MTVKKVVSPNAIKIGGLAGYICHKGKWYDLGQQQN